MKIDKEFILREIAGDYIIIPTGKTILDFNGMITVNEVGAFLWEKLQKDVTLNDLIEAVVDEYDVEESQAKADIEEFLATLIKGEILEDTK